MREVDVYVISRGAGELDSFFSWFESLLPTRDHYITSQHEETLGDGRTQIKISFMSDLDVDKIRSTLCESTTKMIMVFCPNEALAGGTTGDKRTARRKAGRAGQEGHAKKTRRQRKN